jgi:hypothetical protein
VRGPCARDFLRHMVWIYYLPAISNRTMS